MAAPRHRDRAAEIPDLMGSAPLPLAGEVASRQRCGRGARASWAVSLVETPSPQHSPASGRGSSGLTLGRRNGETVEFVAHLDLARQARVRPHVEAEIEHVLFHRRGAADLLAPGFVDIDMARRAGAGAAAFRLDCREWRCEWPLPSRSRRSRRRQCGFRPYGRQS